MADNDLLELLSFVYEQTSNVELLAMNAARKVQEARPDWEGACLNGFESIMDTAVRQKQRLASQIFEVLRSSATA